MADNETVQATVSAQRLLRSTVIAAVVAAVILVVAVLPAEYAVDPTGIGRVLGLTQMGEIKMQIAREEAAHDIEADVPVAPDPAPVAAPDAADSGARTDTTEVVLAPGQALEIKLAMVKDAQVTYAWQTNGGVVNYDTHADSPTIDYHGYSKGTGVPSHEGVITAAFDGYHGWFWRNRSGDPVTVTLVTTGAYTEIKRLP
jgi:hypothetical protein